MKTFTKDGITYVDRQLPHNQTVAVLDAPADVLKIYNSIEQDMTQRYEPFSLVYDDGILVNSLADDFIGFVLGIDYVVDAVRITTTDDRQFFISLHNEYLDDIRQYQTNLLVPAQLSNADFTDVFTSVNNTISIDTHKISAFIDSEHRQLIICDDIKRYGYLTGFCKKGFTMMNEGYPYIFLFDMPDVDIASHFKNLGIFFIKNSEIYFRTDYDYKFTQDFIVRDIHLAESGEPEVVCATQTNPDMNFILEV